MNTKNSSGLLYGAIAFATTLGLIFYFTRSSSSPGTEYIVKFHHPQKIEVPDTIAYTMDTVDGAAKDFVFRCNPTTGEGFFNLKSKNLTWASSHCQDMVGGVKDIEDGKKKSATVRIKKEANQVSYQVERNK